MSLLKQILVDRLGRRRDLYAWRNDQPPLEVKPGARVCLLHLDGRLGDAVINSAIASAFERHHPSMELWIGTTPAYLDYWSSHPFVKRAVTLRPTAQRSGVFRFKEIGTLARPFKGVFDIVVYFDPFVQLDTFYLLDLLQAKSVVGFSKPHYQLFDYSLPDRQFDIEKEHITARIERLLRLFGISSPYREFPNHVPTTPESDAKAEELMTGSNASGSRILFNAYGGGADKTFNGESIQRILGMLFAQQPDLTVFLSLPLDHGKIDGFERGSLEIYGGRVKILYPARELSVLFSCVRKVDGVLATDTAAGHIGAAMDKPLLTFFHDISFGPIAWRPFSNRCEVVVSRGGRDVNDQDWALVPRSISGFLDRVENQRQSNKTGIRSESTHRNPAG